MLALRRADPLALHMFFIRTADDRSGVVAAEWLPPGGISIEKEDALESRRGTTEDCRSTNLIMSSPSSSNSDSSPSVSSSSSSLSLSTALSTWLLLLLPLVARKKLERSSPQSMALLPPRSIPASTSARFPWLTVLLVLLPLNSCSERKSVCKLSFKVPGRDVSLNSNGSTS